MPKLFFLIAFSSFSCNACAGGELLQRDDVREFIASRVEKHGFEARELASLFGRVRTSRDVIV
ncbi:MAG: hypothetical protein HYY36_07500, partial [Gammaproteobacteria bacterium]|nr:hypothetical protein [Gammaproteobacteria bacterium]